MDSIIPKSRPALVQTKDVSRTTTPKSDIHRDNTGKVSKPPSPKLPISTVTNQSTSSTSPVKTAPKSLRILPKGPSSRKTSIASAAPVPSTPISLSSMTSASVSRANSPPPLPSVVASSGAGASKVGSAPVRAKTKTQVRKDRQERREKAREEEAKVEDVVETPHEAIIARKKKTKKDRPVSSRSVTPATSRPPSPSPSSEPAAAASVTFTREKKKIKLPDEKQTSTKKSDEETSNKKADVKKTPTKIIDEKKTTPMVVDEKKAASTPVKEEAKAALDKSVDDLIKSLTERNESFKRSLKIFAKGSLPSPKDPPDPPAHWTSEKKRHELSDGEVEGLLDGSLESVRYGGPESSPGNTGLVTPSGTVLRCLSPDSEARYLELERSERARPAHLSFHPRTVYQGSYDLPALQKAISARNARAITAMEAVVQDVPLGRYEYLVDNVDKYLDEFILPPAREYNRPVTPGVFHATAGTTNVKTVPPAQATPAIATTTPSTPLRSLPAPANPQDSCEEIKRKMELARNKLGVVDREMKRLMEMNKMPL
ncbi:hypothetical protein K470DRAFT_264407 [Piedraia hortae CBS 480.64]|uniref:Uncharacterized protein n=1 Tax=Piedraia hortae CBS 480.64 TaxID=1314780 RepID=A0A6A7C0Y9_9PEZI|nr:hypothetical protein K470DRAFT_264407 [Piedraia hortae CBS 480.64]